MRTVLANVSEAITNEFVTLAELFDGSAADAFQEYSDVTIKNTGEYDLTIAAFTPDAPAAASQSNTLAVGESVFIRSLNTNYFAVLGNGDGDGTDAFDFQGEPVG